MPDVEYADINKAGLHEPLYVCGKSLIKTFRLEITVQAMKAACKHYFQVDRLGFMPLLTHSKLIRWKETLGINEGYRRVLVKQSMSLYFSVPFNVCLQVFLIFLGGLRTLSFPFPRFFPSFVCFPFENPVLPTRTTAWCGHFQKLFSDS